jgi:SAM-dependent methyltransferase
MEVEGNPRISHEKSTRKSLNVSRLISLQNMMKRLYYYWGSTNRRKLIDRSLKKHESVFNGVVLDIGGRDRGKFKKPRDKVEKWIFADIEASHNPDIVLDVADMKEVENGSIDVISAMELFEHVEKIDKGLQECHRVLKKKGLMMMSIPFLYRVHADPYDFQRWTEDKWRNELKALGFEKIRVEITGRYFTVLTEMIKTFIHVMPIGIRHFGYLFYPLFDLLSSLDRLKSVQNHSHLGKFHGGYFILCEK